MDATSLSLTVAQLRELYCAHAKRVYRRRDGDPTRGHLNARTALSRFAAHVGEAMPADRINRHQVRAWLDQQAAEGLSRAYINDNLGWVRRWVRWSCDLDHIPFPITEDLQRVHPLRAFRSEAKEPAPSAPPSLAAIDTIIPHLPALPRDVMRVIRLTGARLSEVLDLLTREVLTDEPPRMSPVQHKNAHHGHARVIPLPAAALAIIQSRWRPLLADDRVFRTESGGRCTTAVFRAAVRRACRAAGVPCFLPKHVRHAVARYVRRERGLDAAQALLGHSSAQTTEIYAPLRAGQSDALDAARRATEVL